MRQALQVRHRLLAAVRDPDVGHVRVVRDPHLTTGPRRRAADEIGLLEDGDARQPSWAVIAAVSPAAPVPSTTTSNRSIVGHPFRHRPLSERTRRGSRADTRSSTSRRHRGATDRCVPRVRGQVPRLRLRPPRTAADARRRRPRPSPGGPALRGCRAITSSDFWRPTRRRADRRPTSKRESGVGSTAGSRLARHGTDRALDPPSGQGAGGPLPAPSRRGPTRWKPVRLAPTDRARPRRPVTGRRRGSARGRHRAVRVGRRAVPDGASRRRRAPAGDARRRTTRGSR